MAFARIPSGTIPTAFGAGTGAAPIALTPAGGAIAVGGFDVRLHGVRTFEKGDDPRDKPAHEALLGGLIGARAVGQLTLLLLLPHSSTHFTHRAVLVTPVAGAGQFASAQIDSTSLRGLGWFSRTFGRRGAAFAGRPFLFLARHWVLGLVVVLGCFGAFVPTSSWTLLTGATLFGPGVTGGMSTGKILHRAVNVLDLGGLSATGGRRSGALAGKTALERAVAPAAARCRRAGRRSLWRGLAAGWIIGGAGGFSGRFGHGSVPEIRGK